MLLSSGSLAAGWTIDQLMHGFAQTREARTAFTEKKYMAVLDAPVESSGELIYTAPDKLEKRTIKPRPEIMQLDGDTLLLERGRKKFTLQLQESPELAALIESMRGTLAGDRKALERNFSIGLEGTSERWVLLLTPTNAKASQTIKHIRMSGAKYEVLEIDVVQADGDRTITTIEKTRP